MKRIIFSDLHLHKWTYGTSVTSEGYNSRLWQQWLAIVQMLNYIEENNIKYVYFAGDLFHAHGNISTEALTIATAMFTELNNLGVKVRAIPGNHDMADRLGRIHGLSFLPYEVISGPWVDEGLNVYALQFTSNPERLKSFLGDAGKGDGGMVLLHQGVAGVPISSGYLIDEILKPEMIPDNCVAFTGHYHFHKKVNSRLTVIGNLVPLNWNDIDQAKGWLVWDDETGEIEQCFQSASPAFISWNESISRYNDISNVKGAFVRYIDPVSTKEMNKIREDLLLAGALEVQFSNWKAGKKQKKIRTGDKITMESILEQYEKLTDGRRREVGIEVREDSYETPEV